MIPLQFVLLLFSLILAPVTSWNLRAFRFIPECAVKGSIVSGSSMPRDKGDSRLFYQDVRDEGVEDFIPSLLIASDHVAIQSSVETLAVPFINMKPRAMDLPRHSPPKEFLRRQKMMFDAEMIVGRLAMVAALILFGNELITGTSMADQMTGLLQ